jgi:uncharacterized membrane protein
MRSRNPNFQSMNLISHLVGLCLYLTLVCTLYGKDLTNLGAVACIVGILIYFRILLKSRVISGTRLLQTDPAELQKLTRTEFLKASGFIACGIAAATVLKMTVQRSLIPDDLATVSVGVAMALFFGLCTSFCLVRAITALIYSRKRR